MTSILKIREERNLQTKKGIIERYQCLIIKIAKQFQHTNECRENLEEVGYIGLLNAINLYDKNIHQIDFKVYAQILITEEMHQYLMNRNRKVDRPNWLIHLNEKIDEFVIQYRQEYQFFPQVSEIAAHLNIHSFGLQEVLKARDSLRECHYSNKIDQYIDLPQMQPNLEKIRNQSYQSFKLPIEDLIVLRKALKRIKKLQEGIIYYLFVLDLSQTKLAKILGISKQEASQIKKKAANHLQ